MKYYMYINRQQVGPYEESELLSKGLTPSTNVWREGMANWTVASQVPELSHLFAAPASQPPAYQQPPQPAYQQPQQPAYQQQARPTYQQPQQGGYQQPQQPAYQQAAPGYRQPQYGGAQRPPMPDNYLVWAILVTIFCCLPFGIVSIVKASQVSSLYNQGDYQGAVAASESAKKWVIWSVIAAAIGGVLYILLYAILGVSFLSILGASSLA